MRTFVLLLSTTVLLRAESLNDLVRDSLRFLDPSQKSQQYEYTVRSTRKQFDSDGKLKSQETTVAARTIEDDTFVYRVRERNGKPLTPAEQAQQEQKIAKRLAELRSLPPAERERQKKQWNGRGMEFVRELPDAMVFRQAGETTANGRRSVIVDAEPNPQYHARTAQARLFEKLKGRFTIDVTDREMVKAEAETFDVVSIGLGILGRVEKGTRFAMQRRKLADGNWVVAEQDIRFGARVMLVKWFSNEIHSEFSDFRHKSQLTASR